MLVKSWIYYPKIIFAVLLIANINGFSQKNIRLALMNQANTFPSFRLIPSPVHPGFSIGTDLRVRGGNNWKRTLGVDASYFHQRLAENAVMLDATYSIGYKFDFGLQPKFMTALGYKQSFAAGEIYELINGEYTAANPIQKSQANFKLGFGLDYPLNKNLSITTDYRAMIASPFSQKTPFMLHNFLRVGVNINLKK